MASAKGSLLGRGGRDVIGDIEGAGVYALSSKAVAGHIEVHLVAGIVAAQDHEACLSAKRASDSQHILAGGRGEDISHHAAIHKAVAHDAAEGRVMARSAAVHDGHFGGGGFSSAHHAAGRLHHVAGIGGHVAGKHFVAKERGVVT